jgi:hypothetical protein
MSAARSVTWKENRMAHTHGDTHSDTNTYREVDVIDRSSGIGPGLVLAIAALLLIVVIGLAVVWSRPWSSSGTNNNNNPSVPGISDNGGGGNNGPGGSDNGGSSGGQPAP